MRYFIGVNAGGTKTDFVLAGTELNIIYSSSAAACNLKKEGIEKAVLLLDEIFNAVLSLPDVNKEEIEGICAGFAGGGRENDAADLTNSFRSFIKAKYNLEIPVLITTDALITLEGAFNGKEGVVLIAGTGSIIYAKDNKGIFHRAGGFGRIIGDEGSGYSTGRKGLAAAAKFFDSRGKETLLVKFLKNNYNITSTEELIKKVYEEDFEIPAVAPLVIQCASENDEICRRIVEEETNELLFHIKAVKNYFGNSFMLCLSGGIITTDNYFSAVLKEKIKSLYPGVEVVEPEYTPETGAIILLKKKLGL
jgi:N-acetylglucosamine kinase-like BadF-type ATPase